MTSIFAVLALVGGVAIAQAVAPKQDISEWDAFLKEHAELR